MVTLLCFSVSKLLHAVRQGDLALVKQIFDGNPTMTLNFVDRVRRLTSSF